MNVLLTGHVGFLGARVARLLVQRRIPWTGIDVRSVRDHERVDLSDLVSELPNYTAIVHCAAYADIAENWTCATRREHLFDDNVRATFRLLQCVPQRLKRFVFVSSACVDDPAESPYKATKIAGEAMVKAWAAHHGFRYTIVRPASMVGPGYRHGHIVDFVRQAKETGKVHAKDDGKHAKPFVHVDRVATATVNEIVEGHGRDQTLTFADARWSWRDTVKLMGVPFTWEEQERGWEGDPLFEQDLPHLGAQCAVTQGVIEVLEEQGWKLL